MTKLYSTPPDAVLVAIDMSKHRQEVLLERPEGGRRRRMTVMATKADYDRLADDLTTIGRPVIVGFEATGNPSFRLSHHPARIHQCPINRKPCKPSRSGICQPDCSTGF